MKKIYITVMIGLLACLVGLGREVGHDFQNGRYFAFSIFSFTV